MTERMGALLARLVPKDRAELLELLDQIMRPMTLREVERALHRAGISRTQSTAMAGAFKGLTILLIAEEPERKDNA